MSERLCNHLDGYLGDALAPNELEAFVAHMDDCPSCRQALAEQRRLEQLLNRATLASSPVPAGLVDRIEDCLLAARRRRIATWSVGLAATVFLGIGATLWFMRSTPELVNERQLTQVVPVPAADVAVTPPRVEVTVTSSSEVVAVPVPSRNPNVTILWMYPTRHASARDKPSL